MSHLYSGRCDGAEYHLHAAFGLLSFPIHDELSTSSLPALIAPCDLSHDFESVVHDNASTFSQTCIFSLLSLGSWPT